MFPKIEHCIFIHLTRKSQQPIKSNITCKVTVCSLKLMLTLNLAYMSNDTRSNLLNLPIDFRDKD